MMEESILQDARGCCQLEISRRPTISCSNPNSFRATPFSSLNYMYIYNMISRLLVSFPQLPDCPNSLLLLVNCPNCGVSVVSGRNLPHHVCCSIDYWHSFQHFPKIPSQLLKVNNINSHKVPQTVLNSQKLPETAKCDGPMLNYNDLTLRRHPK